MQQGRKIMNLILAFLGLPNIAFFKMWQEGDKRKYKIFGIIYSIIGCVLFYWFLVYSLGINMDASYNPYENVFECLFSDFSYFKRLVFRGYREYFIVSIFILLVLVYWISGIVLMIRYRLAFQVRKDLLKKKGYSLQERLLIKLETEYKIGKKIQIIELKSSYLYYILLVANLLLYVINLIYIFVKQVIPTSFLVGIFLIPVTFFIMGKQTKTSKWNRFAVISIIPFILSFVFISNSGWELLRSLGVNTYSSNKNIHIFATAVFYITIIVWTIFIVYLFLIQKEYLLREKFAKWIKKHTKSSRDILIEEVEKEVTADITKKGSTQLPGSDKSAEDNNVDDEATFLGNRCIVDDVSSQQSEESRENKCNYILPIGTLLDNRYEIEEILGEGGFGITYKGTDVKLSKKIAIKEYFPAGYASRHNQLSKEVSFSNGENAKYYKDVKNKFLVEAKVLAKFSDEPGIVNVNDYFEENNTAYIIMEYLSGENLKDYVEKLGKIHITEVKQIFRPIMQSLKVIHENGYIHRDISPSNIIFNRNNGAKLLDFGSARDVEPEHAKTMSILLKPGYTPMEQYLNKSEQGPFTDIYALGATIYKCLTGITPDDCLKRATKDELKSIKDMGIELTDNAEKAIFKAMSIHKEKRYHSVEAFKKAFYQED